MFYSENDYPSVEFITKLSLKHILIFISMLCGFFIIFPEILLDLFNVVSVQQQSFIALVIRITSLGLIGRFLCMFIADYAQAVSSFRISALINFLREGFFPFVLILIFIPLMGGFGIWITLALCDIIPVFVYLAVVLYYRKIYSSFKNSALRIPDLVSYHWTSIRGSFEEMDENMMESNKKIIRNIKKVFGDDYLIVTSALEGIAKNIFEAEKTVCEIDISIILNDDFVVLRFIYDGNLYGPFKNDKLIAWANKNESRGINIINDKIHEMYIKVKCDNGFIVVDTNTLETKKSVDKEGIVKLNTKGKASISEITCNIDLAKPSNIKKIEKKINNKIKDLELKAIKLSKKYSTDIFGIGLMYYQDYPHNYNKIKNYDKFYKNIKFKTSVDIKINTSSSIKQTLKNIEGSNYEKDN